MGWYVLNHILGYIHAQWGGVNRLIQSQYKLQQLQQYTITFTNDVKIVSE